MGKGRKNAVSKDRKTQLVFSGHRKSRRNSKGYTVSKEEIVKFIQFRPSLEPKSLLDTTEH